MEDICRAERAIRDGIGGVKHEAPSNTYIYICISGSVCLNV